MPIKWTKKDKEIYNDPSILYVYEFPVFTIFPMPPKKWSRKRRRKWDRRVWKHMFKGSYILMNEFSPE